MSKSVIKIEKKVTARPRGKRKRGRPSKPALILLLILSITVFVLVGSIIYLVVIPAQKVTGSVDAIMSNLAAINQDMESKDLRRLDEYVGNISTELGNISTEVDKYEFLKDIDFTKGYYDNLQVVQKISNDVETLLSTALPELKVILKSVGYTVDGEAPVAAETDAPNNEDQIKGIIKELPRVINLYDDIESQVIEIINEFNQIDPGYVPEIGSGGFKQ
ncbi:hypothetical protein KC640_01510, partial [Candidatus Dojkabacteria bacterium]|nr:hypothetical protein [Candidatus Dojkabacteria bacterium]